MDLSIVTVNWNTKTLLDDCLSSVFKFTQDLKFEVIVVDNGSDDGSGAMVKKKFPQVKLILNQKNLGFSKANNQGIEHAKGQYILLLNSDTYLVENSFKKLVEKARNLNGLGAFGPQLKNIDGSIQQSAGFFPNLPQIFWWMTFIDDLPFGSILRPFHIDHDSFYQNDHQVDWVTGAAILVPKMAINKVGPLDEKIFMYGEEVDWCYRIKRAGFSIYFSPVTKIFHIARGSVKKLPTPAIVGEYKGIIYFYQKHRGFIALQIARLLLKMGALMRIFAFGVQGRKELVKSYVQAYKVA